MVTLVGREVDTENEKVAQMAEWSRESRASLTIPSCWTLALLDLRTRPQSSQDKALGVRSYSRTQGGSCLLCVSVL